MEYLPKRDLRTLLVSANIPVTYANIVPPADAPITDSLLSFFVDQIVDGMVYLSEKKVNIFRLNILCLYHVSCKMNVTSWHFDQWVSEPISPVSQSVSQSDNPLL